MKKYFTAYLSHCIPVSLQVEDLKWEVEQRQREIETQKQQLEMVEQCHHREMDTLQDMLQVRCFAQHFQSVSYCCKNVYLIIFFSVCLM